NVAARDELDEVGIVCADQPAPLVARADQGGLDRPHRRGETVVAVAEKRGGGDRHGGAGGDHALHEAASRHAAGDACDGSGWAGRGTLLLLVLGGRVSLGELADDAIEVALAGRLLFRGHVESHGILLSISRAAHEVSGHSLPLTPCAALYPCRRSTGIAGRPGQPICRSAETSTPVTRSLRSASC